MRLDTRFREPADGGEWSLTESLSGGHMGCVIRVDSGLLRDGNMKLLMVRSGRCILARP